MDRMNGLCSFLRQISVLMRKYYLIKRSHSLGQCIPFIDTFHTNIYRNFFSFLLFCNVHEGFAAELLLPIMFMALLIIIKNITDKFDSPDIAYYCGNTLGFGFYGTGVDLDGDKKLLEQEPFVCAQRPHSCRTDHYYLETDDYKVRGYSVKGFGQYGKSSEWPMYCITHCNLLNTPKLQAMSSRLQQVGNRIPLSTDSRSRILPLYTIR